MADVKEVTIDRFDLGILDQDRDLPNGYFKYLENLEIGDDVRGVVQTFNTTKDNGGYSTSFRSLRRVLEVNGIFYALGNDGSGDTGIWKKDGANWTVQVITANYAIDYRDNAFFVYDAGYILFHNNEKIGLYKVSDGTNNGDFLSLAGGLKGGTMWQGKAYGWNGQKIYKINVGDYSSTQTITEMLEIPSDQTIVDFLDYGNLAVIVCTSTTNESLMYIWDGVTTTTFYDIVKIGRGTVSGGVNLDGIITVVIESNGSVIIKQYDQVDLKTVYTYRTKPAVSGKNPVNLTRIREYNGYMYILGITSRPDDVGGASYVGDPVVFRYGSKTAFVPNSFCIYKYFDYVQTDPANLITDLILHEATTSVHTYGPSIFALVTEDNGGNIMVEVNEIQTNSAKNVDQEEGIIETGIYTLDASILKALKSVNVQLSALPAAGKVVVKIKTDANSTWTTIATNTTDDTISNTSVNIESSGVNLPEFREIAFRIELSGGAEITRLIGKYEEKYGL